MKFPSMEDDNLMQSVSEVDDFVLQEFLADAADWSGSVAPSSVSPDSFAGTNVAAAPPPMPAGSGGGPADTAEQRRKRQRESNLQAQRRSRERHRKHVSHLEADVVALRVELDASKAENARLQTALQQSLLGLEECQKRFSGSHQALGELSKEKEATKQKLEETLEKLRICAGVSEDLRGRLQNGEAAKMEIVKREPGDCAPCDELEARMKIEIANGAPPSGQSLQADAKRWLSVATIAKKTCEREKTCKNREEVMAGLKRVGLRLQEAFRSYLIDGNACSNIWVFAIKPVKPGEPSPCAAMEARGPGQDERVIQRAREIASELDLSDQQREDVVTHWKEHAKNLTALFEQRKKLTADALVLQGSSPVATLIDFLSIGTGLLSTDDEAAVVDRGGQQSLTGFAQHACKVEGAINALRQSIGAEQMLNFSLVSTVVTKVLTPLQTCFVCASWDSDGCPDMLAISRAITVQSMEKLPHLQGGR